MKELKFVMMAINSKPMHASIIAWLLAAVTALPKRVSSDAMMETKFKPTRA